jgi:Zn-dependent protease with chaperone function
MNLIFSLFLAVILTVVPAQTPKDDAGIILVSSLGVWMLLAFVVSRWKQGSVQKWWRLVWPMGTLGLHAYWCLELQWQAGVPSTLYAMGPFLLGFLWCWWLVVPAPRWRNLWQRSAMIVLPLMLLVGASDLLDCIPGYKNSLWVFVASISLLLILPVFLLLIWRTRPFARHPRAQTLAGPLAAAGIKIAALRIWPTGMQGLVNAAALGFVPGLRWIVVTEPLVQELSDEELLAVIGHESGHLKHGHAWLFLLCLLTASLWSIVLQTHVFEIAAVADIFGVFIGLGLWAATFAALFLPAIRAAERQADLDGAALSGYPAMVAALSRTAELAGMHPTAPDVIHRPIATRIAFLQAAQADPAIAHQHHRSLRRMRMFLLFLALTGLLLLFAPSPQGPNLADLQKQFPELAPALAESLENPRAPKLDAWLSGRSEEERQDLALAILANLVVTGAADDDALLPRYRGYLSPFRTLSLGKEELERNLLNIRVYAAAIDPFLSDEELERLPQEIKNLEGQENLEAEEYDTLGCARWCLGDRVGAQAAFKLAMTSENQRKAPDSRMLELYQHRLKSAENPNGILPLVRKVWNKGEWKLEPVKAIAQSGRGNNLIPRRHLVTEENTQKRNVEKE